MIFTQSQRSVGKLDILFLINDMTLTSVSFYLVYFGIWESQKQWERWELLCNRSLFFALYLFCYIYIKKNVAEHISWISGRSRDGGHIFFDCISVFIALPSKPSMQIHSGCKRNKPRRLSFPLIPRLLELRGIYFQGKARIFYSKRCQNPLDEFHGR